MQDRLGLRGRGARRVHPNAMRLAVRSHAAFPEGGSGSWGISWAVLLVGKNLAHSEQVMQKTGHFPYRLANSLIDTGLTNGLHKALLSMPAPSSVERLRRVCSVGTAVLPSNVP